MDFWNRYVRRTERPFVPHQPTRVVPSPLQPCTYRVASSDGSGVAAADTGQAAGSLSAVRLQPHRQRVRRVSGVREEHRLAMRYKDEAKRIARVIGGLLLSFVTYLFNGVLRLSPRKNERSFRLTRKIHHERIKLGHCQQCDYNLTGNVSGVCPECGTPVARCPEGAKDSSPG